MWTFLVYIHTNGSIKEFAIISKDSVLGIVLVKNLFFFIGGRLSFVELFTFCLKDFCGIVVNMLLKMKIVV